MNPTSAAIGRQARRERLRALMDRLDLAALLLRRPANFAWYTGGADNRIDHTSPTGVADVLVTGAGDYILTSNIEARRMREEQTPDIEVIEYPWYGGALTALRAMVGSGAIGADSAEEGVADVASAVAPLRYVLDADAIERYWQVGADAEAALAEVAPAIKPGMTETEAAARLVAACRQRGLFTPVILAAADDRIANYRHPIPHSHVIERRAMLVVCAERGGLYANLTQMVHFVEPDAELRRRQDACETILRRLREEATRPGRALGEAFSECQRYYAEAGFPDEWQLHHQGGLTGYASRELVATPETRQVIEVGQAFAWNPSVTGAKAEETFILTATGPEVIARAR